jgi:cell division protein FtsB
MSMAAPGMPHDGKQRLNRKKENSPLQSRGLALLLFFFLFILVLAFVFGDRGIVEIVKTQKQIKDLQLTISGLEAEKLRLTREIELLRKNPLALEKKARENLWLMKKNEKVVVLVKDKEEAKHE